MPIVPKRIIVYSMVKVDSTDKYIFVSTNINK